MGYLVFIILVNYNNVKETIECIESLKTILYKNYKIIVVDNGSTDDSVSVLKEYSQGKKIFELICLKENKGFSYGNNIGIKNALMNEADYIVLLNNDTVVEPDFLKYLLESFTVPSVGITTSKILYESERNKIWYNGGNINFQTAKIKHFDFNGINSEAKDRRGFVSFISGCCMCISRETIDRIGLLDESYFLYEEDTDYCMRALNNDIKLFYESKSVIYHKVSSSTGKVNGLIQYYMVRNKLFFIKKYYKGINKIVAYIYSMFLFIKRIIMRELFSKNVFRAIKDFINNRKGKSCIYCE